MSEQETTPEYVAAHDHSFKSREELLRSEKCGCFYCCRIFPPSEVVEWTDEDALGLGQTAICPRCAIDAVIGDASGYPIDRRFLKKMKAHWF